MKRKIVALSLLVTCLSTGSHLCGSDKGKPETKQEEIDRIQSQLNEIEETERQITVMEEYHNYKEDFDFTSGKSPMGPTAWSKINKNLESLKARREARAKIKKMLTEMITYEKIVLPPFLEPTRCMTPEKQSFLLYSILDQKHDRLAKKKQTL